MGSGKRYWAVAALASAGAHALIFSLLARVQAPVPPAPQRATLRFTTAVTPKPPAAPADTAERAPLPPPKRGRPSSRAARPPQADLQKPETAQAGAADRAGGVGSTGGAGPEASERGAPPTFDPRKVDLVLRALPGQVPPAPPSAEQTLLGSAAPQVNGGPAAAVDEDVAMHPRAGGRMEHDDGEYVAKVESDGTISFEDRYVEAPTLIIDDDGHPHIVLPLDFNDMLLRTIGDDPYSYQKQKIADATRPMRQQMADEACREDLRAALLDIRGQLEAIQRSGLAPHKKRRLYFKLWDDCAEEGPPEVQRTAELIRATILAFVQESMPPSSPLAYSAHDLEALNGVRRSRQRFEPYGPIPDDGGIATP